MANDPFVVTPSQVVTGFKDLRGYPTHMFGKLLKNPVRPVTFDQIWADTGLVIVRDDIFEGTVHIPASLKVGNGPVVVATFFETTNFAYGSNYNIDVTALCATPPFIGVVGNERVHYTDWRMRTLWTQGGHLNGQVFVGNSFGGRVMADMANQMFHTSGGQYLLTPQYQIGDRPFITYWQVELGFGGHVNALSTTLRTTAGPDWPAWSQPIASAP